MFGDLIDLDFSDLGDVASQASASSPDTSNYLSDLSSAFRLGGESGPGGVSGSYSLGLDTGSGAQGMRLASEAATPLNLGGATPSASGGGWGDWLKSFTKDWMSPLADVAKAVAPIAGLGLAGMNVANSLAARDRMNRAEPILREAQQTQIQSARQGQELAPVAAALSPKIEAVAPRQGEIAQTVMRDIAAPQVAYATQLLASVRAGQLPPSEEAEVERFKAATLQKYRDFFARAGMGESTGILQAESMVEEQAQAMRAERLRRIEQTALQYLGGGQSGYGAAGTLNESEARILGSAATPIGIAGNVLAGSAGAAGGAARSVQAEEESIEKLLQQAYAQLGNASGRVA